MAFSTQKDFFNIPFMNESNQLGCKKACVKLKSYESTDDTRAWASDETKQSRFLRDLVSCEYPMAAGEGGVRSTDHQVSSTGRVVASAADVSSPESINTSAGIWKRKSKQSSFDEPKQKETEASGVEIMTGGDSLLQCANVHLTEYQKLLKANMSLENQLKVSNEHLKTVQQENQKILEVLDNKLDSNTTKDFYNKIQKFTAAGKFNKNEENEMLQIYKKMQNMNQSHDRLQAANHYRNCLIEKLKRRIQLDDIPIQPEQSQDIRYLHKEIDSLRKECILLRRIEDDYDRAKLQQTNMSPSITQQDAENIKVIMKERNSLREKCESLKALEQQYAQLAHKAQEAKKEANGLSGSLSDKTQYIAKLEGELQSMQKYYERRIQDACLREESLKAQLKHLKDEFVQAKCEAQKAHMLAEQVSCLQNELLQRELAINDYSCQYTQLVDIVEELKSFRLQSVHDDQTQTCEEQTDELSFYTCATLQEIMQELKRRGCFDNELTNAYRLEAVADHIGQDANEEHCCSQMKLLKQQIIKLETQIQEEANCAELCRDAFERLKAAETERSQLLRDNQELNRKLIESEDKLSDVLRKLERLDEAVNKNGQEAIVIGKGLEENIALVKDISEVQLKNQQLANAVSAINSRDDQKIIDDLRRQLQSELAKLSKCQQDNVHLLEEIKQREAGLKEMKDLNNKLMAENSKLKNREEDNTSETENREKPAAMEYTDKKFPKSDTQMKEKQPASAQGLKENKQQEYEEKKQQSTPTLQEFIKPPLNQSSRADKIKENKQQEYEEKKQQSTPTLQELKKPTTAANQQRTISVDQQKIAVFTDSDGFVTSSPKEAATKQPKVTHSETSRLKEIKPSAGQATPSKNVSSAKPFGDEQRKNFALDSFVSQKSNSLKFNLQSGHCFEKEFRKILEEFILECSIHFCRLYNAKSKLYAICHKLCHDGIEVLTFQELAYIHKKIYIQADKLLPGCMLDMILTEHRDQVESILTSVMIPRLLQSKKLSLKTSDAKIECNDNRKCCGCKNELCCNNSEEMLKDKVSKLEKDIGTAREYLETLRNIPLDGCLSSDHGNSTDTSNSTYRACSAIPKQRKFNIVKQVKKLKARTKT